MAREACLKLEKETERKVVTFFEREDILGVQDDTNTKEGEEDL